jgi:hypothetical protein
MVGAFLTGEAAASAVKATPPVLVSVGFLKGVDWSHTVLVLTAAYTSLQIVFLLWDRYRKLKGKD